MSQGMLRSLAVGLVVVLATFALVTQRTLERGAREMQASDAAFDAGELELAVRHARRAAGLYVPDSEHVARAYERLRAVATGAERARDTALATAAWRATRAAATESRHLWASGPRELAEANLSLARLAELPVEALRLAGDDEARASRLLTPALGFAATLAGLLLMMWYGVSRSGELAWARARVPAALFAAGLVSLGVMLFRV